jgi:hypothetical protein
MNTKVFLKCEQSESRNTQNGLYTMTNCNLSQEWNINLTSDDQLILYII